MENGAHHVDLRAPVPDDTPDVIAGRKKENEIMEKVHV